MLPFKLRIFVGIATPIVLALLVIGIALSLPQTNMTFSAKDAHLIAEHTFGKQTKQEIVRAFITPEKRLLAFPELAIDEPDVIPTHTEINTLLHELGQLTLALKEGQLQVETDTDTYSLAPFTRTMSDLSLSFWIQLACGILGLIICTLVWLPGNLTAGKAGFILTGIAYFFAIGTGAVYGTRALFINEDLFRVLTVINLWSAELFVAGLILFLSNYPRTITPRWLNWLIFISPFILTGIAAAQLHDELAYTTYLPFTLMLLAAIIALICQWRSNTNNKENRAALRWVLLFMAATTLPAILKLYAPIPQEVLVSSFVVMYVGMMIAVTRHKVFNIERWSYKLWAWFLGGIAVLLTDVILASIISTSTETTLALALAIVGWLYFPVRQMIWRRFFIRQEDRLDEWLAQSLPELLQATSDEKMSSRLVNALDAVFRPLKIQLLGKLDNPHGINASGSVMTLLPEIQPAIELSYPADGRRFFNHRDVQIAELIISLDILVRQSLSARTEGALEERARIRQDLHDDLGAKLLQLLHRTNDNERPLVREAIRDLRRLLQNDETATGDLLVIASRWHDEAEVRCNDHQVSLKWTKNLSSIKIPAAMAMHIERALRESISNAIRSLKTPEISVSLNLEVDQNDCQSLCIRIENDFTDSVCNKGLGLENIKQRMTLIGGSAEFHQSLTEGPDKHWQVVLNIPLV
ncbi:MAG: hypothetical protein P1U57_09355 [Oleibacter sp.]|nr:hypothetical protein [Thalassolituus sp.]